MLSEDSQRKLHRIWNETKNRLEILQLRASEGRDLHAAQEFARYILWSGLIKIFEEYACDGPLKIDGAFIRWQATRLDRACTQQESTMDAEDLKSLHEKLDMLAGYVSRL